MKETREKAFKKMCKIAGELKTEWTKDKEQIIWNMADEHDIFVGELDEGIQIEDDVFYFERY